MKLEKANRKDAKIREDNALLIPIPLRELHYIWWVRKRTLQ